MTTTRASVDPDGRVTISDPNKVDPDKINLAGDSADEINTRFTGRFYGKGRVTHQFVSDEEPLNTSDRSAGRGSVYTHPEEVARDMADPRYSTSALYRAKVQRKLARSDI